MNETQYITQKQTELVQTTPTREEIQRLSISSIIDMVELDISPITSNINDKFYFHNGLNSSVKGIDEAGSIIWQGLTYTTFPYELSGLEYSSSGALPRPRLKLGQIHNYIGSLLYQYNNLLGAKVTRIRTLSKFLDGINFPTPRNLIEYSQDYSNSVWTKTTTNTYRVAKGVDSEDYAAAILTDNSTTTHSYISYQLSISNGTQTCLSCYIYKDSIPKSVRIPQLTLEAVNNGTWITQIAVKIDTSTGEIYSASSPNSTIVSYGCESYGNMWKVWVSGYFNAPTQTHNRVKVYPSVGSGSFTTDNVTVQGSITVAGIQLETGVSKPTKYQHKTSNSNGTNPLADPLQEFPREVYYVDRKIANTPSYIELELASSIDLDGVMIPRRQCVQNTCQWVYRGSECNYQGQNGYFTSSDIPTAGAQDVCGKRLRSCEVRFGVGANLPFGGFPGVGRVGYN